MTDTDTFCFPPSKGAPTIVSAKRAPPPSYPTMETRYFQNPKMMVPQKQQQQQAPSSSSIWNMIHTRGGLLTTTTPAAATTKVVHKQQSKQPSTMIGCANNRDLVAMMHEQLERMTTDLVQQQQQMSQQPPPFRQSEDTLWDYLDSLDRVDRGIDEHMPAPVYFTGTEMDQQRKSSPSKEGNNKHKTASSTTPSGQNGFLPSAFNSIRNLVGNVFRLPSLIMGTWNDSNPSSPEHNSRGKKSQEHNSHVFFDVDDIDFLPETNDGQFECYYDLTTSSSPSYQQKPEINRVSSTKSFCDAEPVSVVQQQRSNSCHVGECGEIATKLVDGPEEEKVANTGEHTKQVAVCEINHSSPRLLDNRCDGFESNSIVERQKEARVVESPESTKDDNASPKSMDNDVVEERRDQTTENLNQTKAMDIKMAEGVRSSDSCVRRFVCTPDQELHRMAVIAPRRKRQAAVIKTALVSRSTPIAVKASNSNSHRSVPRCLYHPTKRSLSKNRKEKKRHEITTNIHEDYAASSDSEAEHVWQQNQLTSFTDDTEDDDLLPLTARNLMEPSCLAGFCGESSMNSSAGSAGTTGTMGGRSGPRRNSINFQAAYEKEFPTIRRQGHSESVNGEERTTAAVEENGLRCLVTKANSVYFEIPNSPQRRRISMKALKPKARESSIISSSVGSSPSSFDASGKFWGHNHNHHSQRQVGRREPMVRTLSECSDDDLIEFVTEGGTEYLPEVFSEEDDDDDDDEDYSSDDATETAESETDGEDEDGDVMTDLEGETEEEELDVGRIRGQGASWTRPRNCGILASEATSENSQQDDLPDSGLEEKKVRFGAKPQVRMLCTWDYAHRQARKGHWEEVGRDRVRFADRIRRVEAELRPVLGAQHREKVFNQRFAEEVPIR